MRTILVFSVLLGFHASTLAQDPAKPDVGPAYTESRISSENRRIREILAQSALPRQILPGKEKLKDALDLLSTKYLRKTPLFVDEIGFFNVKKDYSVYDIEVELPNLAGKIQLSVALREMLKPIGFPGHGCVMLVRAGRIDILPAEFATAEHLLKQLVEIEFKDRPLVAALHDLTALTGVTSSSIDVPSRRPRCRLPLVSTGMSRCATPCACWQRWRS